MTTQTAETAPPPQPAAVQASNAQQALRAAELLALEQAAVHAVTWPLRARLVAVQRAAMKAWIKSFGSLNAPGDPIRAAVVAAEVRRLLADITISPAAALDGYTQQALALGVAQAARMTGMHATVDSIGAAVDAPTARIVAALDQTVTAALADAETAVGQISGEAFSQVDAALSKARRAIPKAAAATVTAVNGAGNAGKSAVAQAIGADLLWLAEPDCCTTCAGFAGRLAPAGQPFDIRLASTFTDSPHLWPPGPVEQPPAHPHCRCELVPWLGVEPGATGPSLPEALQREARRAILKGWSLPSESNAERIRAARKLLARHPAAPKTVLAYSRRAVAAGQFPNRNVPHHTPRPRPAKPAP